MKNLIIFDFFGVICSEISPYWLERYFPIEEAVKIKADIIAKADRGEITEMEMFEKIADMTGKRAHDVLNEWLELAHVDFQLLQLIMKYRAQYKIALLSNASDQILYRILDRETLKTYFDKIMISSEEKVAKPDVKIYIKMLESMGVRPEQALFIDDNPANLAGAEIVGIKGVRFVDAERFELEFPFILDKHFGR